MFEITRSRIESDRISDFVALGNLVNGAVSYHSAFIIKYNRMIYEIHYPGPGEGIEIENLKGDYFHKITDTILPEEVPAFIALCKNIQKNANPEYGFFYSGESYDVNGNHLSNQDIGEVMTCVGFCINVMKGYHEEDYLEFTDWQSESQSTKYLEEYCKIHNLDIDKIRAFHRRITPREFLISGFYNNLPIEKKEIEKKEPEVQEYFETISN
jgi:hypothetical protein